MDNRTELYQMENPEELGEFSITRVIIQRFIEIFLSSLIISTLTTIISRVNLVDVGLFIIVSGLASVLFYAFTAISQRNLYSELYPNKTYYYISIISYILFIALNIVIWRISYNAFVWGFLITKTLSFLNFVTVPEIVSIIIFHVIGLLVMIFAPYGMDEQIEAMNAEIRRQEAIRLEEIEASRGEDFK